VIPEELFDGSHFEYPDGLVARLRSKALHGRPHSQRHQDDADVRRGPFKIYLPAVTEGPEATPGVEAPESPRGSETVLLVEDDPQVRQVVRWVLDNNGYRVLEAAGPGDALDLATRHTAPIHLLLTDVVMPQMSGRVLADLLIPERPGMAVLFMSGYTTAAVVQHGVLDPGIAYLQKPFTPDALARAVRRALDRTLSPSPS